MVSSANGVSSVQGRASGIGGAADRKAMRQIRSRVDAVMVGAGTLRAEKLNLGIDDNSITQPLAVIVCGQEPPPISANLLREPSQRLLLIVPEGASEAYAGYVAEDIEVVPIRETKEPGRLDLTRAIRELCRRFEIRHLLAEGGPSINGALFSLGLVDELFVTIAPSLLATTGGHLAAVEEGDSHRLRLLSTTTVGDEVFLRYQVTGTRETP
jgi:riboflavin biosynthesis pyrimidine reductase